MASPEKIERIEFADGRPQHTNMPSPAGSSRYGASQDLLKPLKPHGIDRSILQLPVKVVHDNRPRNHMHGDQDGLACSHCPLLNEGIYEGRSEWMAGG